MASGPPAYWKCINTCWRRTSRVAGLHESEPSWANNITRPHTPLRWLPFHSLQILEEVVTVDRIRWAISTMAPFKSPGKDGIFCLSFYRKVFNTWFVHFSAFTEHLCLWDIVSWRVAEVPFIPKPGRLDYTTAKAFRHNLFLLKGIEKLVDRYLRSGSNWSQGFWMITTGLDCDSFLHTV